MSNYKRVYPMTNENVGAFSSLYNFDGANVLSVLGSGDQYFTSLLNGASDVRIIDVNYTAWLFFRIKFKAIKVLEYDEFIKLFVNREFYDKEIYSKMYKYLNYEELKYYIYLFNNSRILWPLNECFFPNTLVRVSDSERERFIPYINIDNYYKLKDIISKIKMPKFYYMNFLDLDVVSRYDIILLSNIFDYVGLRLYEFMSLIDRYHARDVLIRYYFSYLDIEDDIYRTDMKMTMVDGMINDKNYILSLKR